MASSPAASDRANEDFVGAASEAVIVLDGAGITDTGSICRHGVAWYVHHLGGALLRRLSSPTEQALPDIVADCIVEVTNSHRRTCDTGHPSSPQATVAVLRVGEESAGYLMLADSYLVLDQQDRAPQVITDGRELAVRRTLSPILDNLAKDSAGHRLARDAYIEALWTHRNQPGGYWIAKDDPRAAFEAATGEIPLAGLGGAALLSNGASRYVYPYGLADWPQALRLLRSAGGPRQLIRDLRTAETQGRLGRHLDDLKSPDDATATYSWFDHVSTR